MPDDKKAWFEKKGGERPAGQFDTQAEIDRLTRAKESVLAGFAAIFLSDFGLDIESPNLPGGTNELPPDYDQNDPLSLIQFDEVDTGREPRPKPDESAPATDRQAPRCHGGAQPSP